MKKNVLKELVVLQLFPKQLLLTEISTRNCIYDANFCLYDKKCWDCELGRECFELIGKHGGFDLNSNPDVSLKRINIAKTYVHRKIKNWRHDRTVCDCRACNWLRKTTRILFTIDC